MAFNFPQRNAFPYSRVCTKPTLGNNILEYIFNNPRFHPIMSTPEFRVLNTLYMCKPELFAVGPGHQSVTDPPHYTIRITHHDGYADDYHLYYNEVLVNGKIVPRYTSMTSDHKGQAYTIATYLKDR